MIAPSGKTRVTIDMDDKNYNEIVSLLNPLLDTIGDDEAHTLAPLLELVGDIVAGYDAKNFEVSLNTN